MNSFPFLVKPMIALLVSNCQLMKWLPISLRMFPETVQFLSRRTVTRGILSRRIAKNWQLWQMMKWGQNCNIFVKNINLSMIGFLMAHKLNGSRAKRIGGVENVKVNWYFYFFFMQNNLSILYSLLGCLLKNCESCKNCLEPERHKACAKRICSMKKK